MNYVVKWSLSTLLFYYILGMICVVCVWFNRKRKSQGISNYKRGYVVLWIVWILTATFRYVGYGVGGADANGYIHYFLNCLNISNDKTDLLFSLYNKMIRLFTSDYHVFFFFSYSIMIFSYCYFIENMATEKGSIIPYAILIFLFLRGFNTLRSNLAVSILLFSIVFLFKNNNKLALAFAVLSVLVHKSSYVYAMFIPFYLMFRDSKIGLIKSIIFVIVSYVVAVFAQRYIIALRPVFLDSVSDAYVSYVSRSLNRNFLTSFLVPSIPQIALFTTIVVMRKNIMNYVSSLNIEEADKINYLLLLAVFDLCVVPVIYILGIWRGYEYLYVPRLVIWGEIIKILKTRIKSNGHFIVSICFFIIFILWMYGRIDATWKSSGLMPYIFDLLT